jgi:nucleotide-binding universal stress UspA family protein
MRVAHVLVSVLTESIAAEQVQFLPVRAVDSVDLWYAQTANSRGVPAVRLEGRSRAPNEKAMATQQKPFTVLVGIDYSEPSDIALTSAIAAARAYPTSHVHVVYAIAPVEMVGPAAAVPPVLAGDAATLARVSAELRQHVDKVLSAIPQSKADEGKPLVDRVTTHVRSAHAINAITQLASDIEADLVVVGTHGRRGMARLLLGSIAEGVVRLAPCPVLVARPVGISNGVPAIEPPCPQCVQTRQATGGASFWCERHSQHHERAHTYHFRPVRTSHQSGLLLRIPK